MADNDRKPVVLLLMQGWGLNLSWQKNAIISAEASNFEGLWKKYSHLALKSLNKAQVSNKKFFYETFYRDDNPKTNIQIVNQSFADKSIQENELLQGLYSHISKHNSKLHIIGTISENNRFGDIEHLINLVKISKTNGAYQQYIHLFTDKSSSDSKISGMISDLRTKLSRFDNTEISTITALDSLYSTNGLVETLNNIILGRPKTALSFKKILPLKKRTAEFSNFTATDGRNMISDFDSIIFSDHNCEAILPLSKYFSGLFNYTDTRRPKFLKILYLIDAPFGQTTKAICKNIGSSWFSKLKKNTAILAGKTDLDLISSMIDIPETTTKIELEEIIDAEEEFAFKKVIEFVKNRINKKLDDFIIIDLPFITNSCGNQDFTKVEKTIKNLDRLLPSLESCIIDSDGILLISSFYGMAEEIANIALPFGERNQFSSNPLPLIEVSNNSKKFSQSGLGILDLMNLRYDQSYLKKIIINYLDR